MVINCGILMKYENYNHENNINIKNMTRNRIIVSVNYILKIRDLYLNL